MGQDQSTSLGVRQTPNITPSTSTSTNKHSLQGKLYLQSHQEDDQDDLDSSTIEDIEDENSEQGIIQVVKGPGEEEEEEELVLLGQIKKFEPFIKEQEKGFGLESLLGLKSSAKSIKETGKETQDSLSIELVMDTFFGLQSHVKEHMSHINMEQKILLKRIAYVDELSTSSSQTMTVALQQAKLAADRVSEVALIKEHATRVHKHAIEIFKSLSAIEKHLDQKDRISSSTDPDTRWPELNELRIQASKSSQLPAFERYITSTSDITTVGTSTSPLLERVIVTGEPAWTSSTEFNTENDPQTAVALVTEETEPSSAMSKLRGLSSIALQQTFSND